MKTKNKIILSLVGLITSLLMIGAGLTYAWFILVVDTPDKNTNSIIVKSADLGKTIFYNGDTISINGAYPGWCETKKVSVVSENSTVLKKYYIYLNVVINELEELGSTYGYVTMKSTVVTDETTVTGGSTGSADLQNITYTSGKLLILSGEIGANDKHTYNIEFCFPELSTNQNSQQGKVFNAYLSVDTNIIYDADKECEPAVAFSLDSWKTIQCNVKNGNTSAYNVGDTKEVEIEGYGTHQVRVSNISSPTECTNGSVSQTACGFVLEFTDIIAKYNMNASNTNAGGWPASDMYKLLNTSTDATFSVNTTDSITKSTVKSVYMSLPEELRNIIIDTTTISGHGKTNTTNFTSTDKLYLIDAKEIYGASYREIYNTTAKEYEKQLDYYLNQKVTTSSYSAAIKQYNGSDTYWWLRSALSDYTDHFTIAPFAGGWNTSNFAYGVSPAFRIG